MRISIMLIDQGFRACRKVYMDIGQKINSPHVFAMALVWLISSSCIRLTIYITIEFPDATTWALHYF